MDLLPRNAAFLLDASLAWAALGLAATAVATDLRSREIPDWIPVALLLLGLVSFGNHWVGNSALPITQPLLGAGLSLLFALCLAFLKFEGGDIKVLAACGLVVGFPFVVTLFVAMAFVGGLMGLWLMATKAAGQRDFPFAPAIAAGFLAVAALRTLRWINA